MSRPNTSGKPTKTVACEISEKDHMKIKTLAQLSGTNVRELARDLMTGHDLDALVRGALARHGLGGGRGGSDGGANV